MLNYERNIFLNYFSTFLEFIFNRSMLGIWENNTIKCYAKLIKIKVTNIMSTILIRTQFKNYSKEIKTFYKFFRFIKE